MEPRKKIKPNQPIKALVNEPEVDGLESIQFSNQPEVQIEPVVEQKSQRQINKDVIYSP